MSIIIRHSTELARKAAEAALAPLAYWTLSRAAPAPTPKAEARLTALEQMFAYYD